MKYSALLLIQLLAPISCTEAIEVNPSVSDVVEQSSTEGINASSVEEIVDVIVDSTAEEINALNLEETANVKDVVLQLPIPDCIDPMIFDSICSQVNLSAISRVQNTDSSTLLTLVIAYFNQLENIWLPIETSCAMRIYKAAVNSEDIDKQSYNYIHGEKALTQSYRLYKFLEESKELLKEDTPLAFCKTIFKSLQLKEDLLRKSLVDANLESSLVCDCLSFSKDSKNFHSLVESMSWNDFFYAYEQYLCVKGYVFCSLLKIISLKHLSPEEFSRMVESDTFELPDSITLRELEVSKTMVSD